MNLLAGTRVYLAGPVEHDAKATSWRDAITPWLRKMGVTVYDPLVKPTWLDPICKLPPALYRQALSGEINGLTKAQVFEANTIMRRLCLAYVSSADWIIVYHPKMFTVGTFEEIFLGANIQKPTFFCAPDGIISTWALPVFATPDNHEKVFFPNWDSLKQHIDKLDSGDEPMDPFKWVSVCYPPAVQYPSAVR